MTAEPKKLKKGLPSLGLMLAPHRFVLSAILEMTSITAAMTLSSLPKNAASRRLLFS